MSNPATDFLASRSFPELADAVRAVILATAAHWEHAVRQALPTADRLTMEQLRDDLPQVLADVADALLSDQHDATEVLVSTAPKHGGVRYEQGFKLPELFIEYGILRMTLVSQLAIHLRRNLEPAEILALGAALDVTLGRAVGRFVEQLTGELRAATEAQSKYLSFLSHDLRGGLNGVFLMIEVLKRELSTQPQLSETLEDLDIMRRSLIDTVATMDRFLHAERFRKGKVQVRRSSLSLKRMLDEMASHINYQAKDKGVELKVEVPGELPVVSDRELLTLILQNLVSNAVKYTAPNSLVRLVGDCNDASCRVCVIDQGPGIAPEQLKNLFGEFSRGETYGQPGMGLGLNIARQAAQYLGAKLWAESEPGKGSSFILELPR